MADFLLEIGTEEIPARMIDGAREELARRVSELVERERLSDSVAVESYSTPRRLAVIAKGLRASQPDVEEQVLGPSVKVAYKDGEPQPPAHAFAKKAGIDLRQVERVTTPKGEYIAATVAKKGRGAAEILGEFLPKEFNSIYWAKSMYWRPGKTSERFVRPVRWMVALLDGSIVPLEFDGIRAGNRSRGHRILSQQDVIVRAPQDYRESLASAAVVVDRTEREYKIRKALDAATRTVPGARWREDKELLETVVNLTESPSVILGSFDSEFLSLPEEVLVTVMRDHQKYFAVEDAHGKLAPYFLAVLNTTSDPEGLIRHGNERVLRARFNDARFFWNTDQKFDLRQRFEWLKSVTFQKDLGSYYDKTCRFQKLASLIAETAIQGGVTVRGGVVHKAALLAKADLTTELVKEFTELQGIVGGLYAKVQAERLEITQEVANAVSEAVYDHYRPESMDDSVPRSVEGALVAISDKADTIAGMFALGLIPSGSKDPFALRRAANGIVKIIAEHNLPLSLKAIFEDARTEYKGSEAELRFTADDKYKENVADVPAGTVGFLSTRGERLPLRRGERGAGIGRGRCGGRDCAGGSGDRRSWFGRLPRGFRGVQTDEEHPEASGRKEASAALEWRDRPDRDLRPKSMQKSLSIPRKPRWCASSCSLRPGSSRPYRRRTTGKPFRWWRVYANQSMRFSRR